MKLEIAFDEEIIRRYYNRGSPIVFSIYWNHDNEDYPSSQWTDFGVVILGWWLVDVRGLVRGADQEEFLFMDGPFSLLTRRNEDTLHISLKRDTAQWTVPLKQFISEIVRGAETVRAELVRLDIAPDDQRMLTNGIEALQALGYE